jgi:hypothetical protein
MSTEETRQCEAEATLEALYSAEMYFNLPRYRPILEKAEAAYKAGDFKGTTDELNRLPTEHKLMQELVEKLKGKSIHKTLERAGKALATNLQKLKAISSLLTHVIIECEHGNTEYRILIPKLMEQINTKVWDLNVEMNDNGK